MKNGIMARVGAAIVLGAALAGCGPGPSAANIKLRKENQDLRDQVAQLQRQHDADAAQLQVAQGPAPTTTVGADRLGALFTTHGIALRRITGGNAVDGVSPYDTGLTVAAVPIDDDGQILKAAGSFEIEAFDLAAEGEKRVGDWTFSTKEARQHWLGHAFQYNYVFECAWQTRPAHAELTVKVTFTDELTGRKFTAQKQVRVNVGPGAEGASTAP